MRNSNPYAYLMHMKDAAEAVIAYATANDFEHFETDNWDQAAAIRNLEIIGEAATNISSEFRKEHDTIPRQDIIDFRNVAIHDYMEVDTNIIWDIIKNDIPPLIEQLNVLLEKNDN
ncbi:hypothetical protein A2690_01930 [Candidatus Roizmanbacteria bacterium RIFCSPHIGHO2_01_FULL_39_12b]|uniref:DUF86 domain-containing protein n=1 Tax=Candidatus Roizmanbacteria bacterium RIFCSPHIGHO2_01_FULL_39_12b TaxID=1802030 RepID=A0A1F7GB96_9BACT|nr:MAG: hypothetical protein A2690_01930 [Candidatus Roizmanbacteria bacterium RIFCSPHIGHO2_01_FULL_39_12b]OGK46181.1 MAG: hypothetical protein A3B46_03175 [Candidatus Roizmanbacteria bacterium RIFCSPLOWO2_01_FULL_39_19]